MTWLVNLSERSSCCLELGFEPGRGFFNYLPETKEMFPAVVNFQSMPRSLAKLKLRLDQAGSFFKVFDRFLKFEWHF